MRSRVVATPESVRRDDVKAGAFMEEEREGTRREGVDPEPESEEDDPEWLDDRTGAGSVSGSGAERKRSEVSSPVMPAMTSPLRRGGAT